MKVLVPFEPRIGGGGVVTAVGGAPGLAVYWELVSYDPETGLEGPPLGSLKLDRSKTDKSGLAVNVYTAPTDPGLAGRTDRLRVRYA